MALIDSKTRKEVKRGATITDFRGNKATLDGVYPTQGKNGKVSTVDGLGLKYPSVYGLEFI